MSKELETTVSNIKVLKKNQVEIIEITEIKKELRDLTTDRLKETIHN